MYKKRKHKKKTKQTTLVNKKRKEIMSDAEMKILCSRITLATNVIGMSLVM